MSIPSSGTRSRRRRLGLFSAGVVVTGLLAGIPVATAADASSGSNAGAVASTTTRLTPGRYVVLLREPSAARYNGGNPRFAATRSQGQQFRADNARVRAYTAHLRAAQSSIAREVGVDVDRSYTIASNGFSASLTTKQALELSTDRRVLLVQKDKLVKADTWNTPDFLGLTGKNGSWPTHGGRLKAGDGIVVADLDSGIWPEARSFGGRHLTESPKTKWDVSRTGTATRMEKADGGVFNGQCELGEEFTADNCNTKLIGARSYSEGYLAGGNTLLDTDYLSPRDGNGHGTHTASTAAGKVVDNVETEGVKFGKISGMAPAAKIAAYKVLWEQEDGTASGTTSDIVAAIDDAVSDGADVINFSISGATDTVLEATELAFEGAAEAGVFVSASAGNSGPTPGTVAHNSPWLTTVAATTHHNFDNTLVLGNGRKIVGASVANKPLSSKKLVDAGESVVTGGDADDAALCGPDTLDPTKVSGTIVVCLRGVYDRVAKSAEVKRAGGAGMVLVNPTPNSLDADFHAVPTIHISDTDGATVFHYLAAKGAAATASFVVGNITNRVTPLPQVAGFSSRGPAVANDADILKPDIGAPGVSVLAAVAPPTNSGRHFDLYSGTSMAAPHITGLAAFMLGVHPTWTPQRIQSSMMTTAKRVKGAGGHLSRDLFAEGAGNVNPKRFFDPGLLVMSTPRQWLGFITDQGLNTGVPALAAKDINLPSMAQGQVTSSTTFTRQVVSTMTGTWKVSIDLPGFASTPSVTKVVSKRPGDIQDITFDFTRTTAPLGQFSKGYVTLTGPTTVKLPVALRPVSVKAPASVEGTGVSGSINVPITAGFTGDLPIDVTGLAKAVSTSDSVATNGADLHCVTVTDGTKLARFDVDAADNSADLDMYVYASGSCDPADAFALAGQSATGSADESVTLNSPDPGTYLVEVDGFAAGTAGSPMAYRFDFYDVDASATLGNLTATPNPVPVVNQEETSFDVSWTGLDPAGHYLGILEYEGALAPTMVFVTS
ncbi:S8 family serine peptidase [Nocardioides sp.]|uniref:S8 family serine peptidase n=1 Tax=Nocardioides sp. TaxID=35761 RepID=UPI0031FE7DAF|nr:peptidase and in, kexin, sedolisin [Nocardioides sp.]